jgi:hypothetical protein
LISKIIKGEIFLVNQNKRPFAVAYGRLSLLETTEDGQQTTGDPQDVDLRIDVCYGTLNLFKKGNQCDGENPGDY